MECRGWTLVTGLCSLYCSGWLSHTSVAFISDSCQPGSAIKMSWCKIPGVHTSWWKVFQKNKIEVPFSCPVCQMNSSKWHISKSCKHVDGHFCFSFHHWYTCMLLPRRDDLQYGCQRHFVSWKPAIKLQRPLTLSLKCANAETQDSLVIYQPYLSHISALSVYLHFSGSHSLSQRVNSRW